MSSLKNRLAVLFNTKANQRRKNANQLADFIEGGTHPWDYSKCGKCFIGQYEAMTGGFRRFGELQVFLGIEDASDFTYLIKNFRDEDNKDEVREKFNKDRAVRLLRLHANSGVIQWSAV